MKSVDHKYFSCHRSIKCYLGINVLIALILNSHLNHPHTSDTPVETLPRKLLQNPKKILQTTWRGMSLFNCLGVPVHINKRTTKIWQTAGSTAFLLDSDFSVLFYMTHNSICNFKAIIAALFHVREATRHAMRLGSQRVINMPAISFVWLLGKTNLLHGGA